MLRPGQRPRFGRQLNAGWLLVTAELLLTMGQQFPMGKSAPFMTGVGHSSEEPLARRPLVPKTLHLSAWASSLSRLWSLISRSARISIPSGRASRSPQPKRPIPEPETEPGMMILPKIGWVLERTIVRPRQNRGTVVLANRVSADWARMSAEADARLRGPSVLVAEPGWQNHTRPCGLETWGGTENRPTAVDMSNSHE